MQHEIPKKQKQKNTPKPNILIYLTLKTKTQTVRSSIRSLVAPKEVDHICFSRYFIAYWA